jgi:hypothetical protein
MCDKCLGRGRFAKDSRMRASEESKDSQIWRGEAWGVDGLDACNSLVTL